MKNNSSHLGEYLMYLRTSRGYSQRIVADKLGIDISMLSKIEHGERQVQSRMLKSLAELFGISYKELQIQFLNAKIVEEFSEEPFFIDALENYLSNNPLKK